MVQGMQRQWPAAPQPTPESLVLWAQQITRLLQEGTISQTPGGAEYIVAVADPLIANARVLTGTPTVAWDFATPGQAAANVPNDAVTNAKLANMAQSTIKGRAVGAGTGDPTDLTSAQATAILDAFTTALNGLAPASGGGTANFLRADGSWSVPPGVPTWTIVSKANFESRTLTTTLANDTDLKFAMAANTNYEVRMKVFFDTLATPDFKFALTGPASPNAITVVRKQITSLAATTLAATIETVYTPSTAITGAVQFRGYIEFDLHVRNGTNAGTFAFQWAQNTSDAGATVVLEGSYLEYRVA